MRTVTLPRRCGCWRQASWARSCWTGSSTWRRWFPRACWRWPKAAPPARSSWRSATPNPGERRIVSLTRSLAKSHTLPTAMPELLPPLDRGLPLFAYGLLKPDELGHHRIATLVGRVEPALVRGARLRIRDGLPLLVDDPYGHVEGVLLFPRSGKEDGFYHAVVAFEPARQYEQFASIEAESAAR